MNKDYSNFLSMKSHIDSIGGFKPTFLPDRLMPHARYLTEWAVTQGRGAIIADCGLHKSAMELVWCENMVRQTNKPALLLTPLAVWSQMVAEAERYGVDAVRINNDGSYKPGSRIVVANYEKLHLLDYNDFGAVCGDESSILKSYTGKTQKAVTRFMSKVNYRLLATATAAPNDYIELGTTSEALGGLTYSEMLRRFFKQLDDKGQKKEKRKQSEAEAELSANPNMFKKLAFRVSQSIGQYRLRPHAVASFWRWVASWAKACRRPSDLGFSDDGFVLPPLTETVHTVESGPPPGYIFPHTAIGLRAEREERKRTIDERCGKVVDLVNHNRPAVIWCHTNDEADTLDEMIGDAEQVAGRTPDECKIELYDAFASGQLRVMIIKPKIGAWGLNWQHCNHVVTFATHSYEQHYQAIRRCWRFGQKNPVQVDIIATDGEERVIENMHKKAQKMDTLFSMLVAEMMNSEKIQRANEYTTRTELPKWL